MLFRPLLNFWVRLNWPSSFFTTFLKPFDVLQSSTNKQKSLSDKSWDCHLWEERNDETRRSVSCCCVSFGSTRLYRCLWVQLWVRWNMSFCRLWSNDTQCMYRLYRISNPVNNVSNCQTTWFPTYGKSYCVSLSQAPGGDEGTCQINEGNRKGRAKGKTDSCKIQSPYALNKLNIWAEKYIIYVCIVSIWKKCIVPQILNVYWLKFW